MLRFLHAADIHLGYSQYGESERYNDFSRAYLAMVDAAIVNEVDFVLLAGDLFDARDIDPRTLLVAVEGLRRLASRQIPVLAIEGNHERPRWHDAFSWLHYLAQMDLLVNLSPWHDEGGLVLAPYDQELSQGAYYDLPGGVRVYGCRYYGASTAAMVAQVAAALQGQPERPPYTIMMLHAGVENVLPNMGGLSHAQLAPLQPSIDYVALGHIHKPFEHNDWLYNPGSLETNSMTEAEWLERGYYLVEVDPGPRSHTARLLPGARRDFVRLRHDLTAYRTPAEVEQGVAALVAAEARKRRYDGPVVELTLTGYLAFAPGDLSLELLRVPTQAAFDALLVRVENRAVPPGGVVEENGATSRSDVERHVLQQLIERDERLRASSEEWTGAVLQLKEMALRREAPEQIVAQVHDLLAQHGEEWG
ncbi:MAG: metallophosphoesterase family protein [Anaerolineae bacterium]|jgi:exonuclease SbcD